MQTERQQSARRLDVHNVDTDLEICLQTLEKECSADNWKLIKKYNVLLTTSAISKASRRNQMRLLLSLNRRNQNKSWEDMTRDDVTGLVATVMNEFSKDGQETWSTYGHKRALKSFLRWVKLGNREKNEVGDPEETRHIKIKTPKETLSRENLVTENEIRTMINSTDSLQLKAILGITFEGAFRVSEILTLNLRNVSFDDNGARLKVDGKTGTRQVILVEFASYLLNWYNKHPLRDDPDAPLFIGVRKNNQGKRMSYPSLRSYIKTIGQNAHVGKNVYSHLLRHSGATRMATLLTESQMRKRHGWSKSSPMPARYVHLVDSDVDDTILEHYGLKQKEVKPKIMKCHFCETVNSQDVEFCEKCAKPLNIETAIRKDEDFQKENERKDNQINQLQKDVDELKLRLDLLTASKE